MGHFINHINALVKCNLSNKNRYVIIDKKFLKDKYKTLEKEDRLIVKDKTNNDETTNIENDKKISNTTFYKKRIKIRDKINSLIFKGK